MTIDQDAAGFFHPTSEDEVASLVRQASSEGKTLRTWGSAHSVRASIEAQGAINICLDRMGSVSMTPAGRSATVKVGAGCHLGKNPYGLDHKLDGIGTAGWEASLNWKLDEKGYALSDLGGITHQAVGGFLLTGSSGGSLIHSIDDNIAGLRLVDGKGEVHELTRDDDLFWAAGVSMGLLGVVTEVTFEVEPRYELFGDQVTVGTADDDAPVHLFAPNKDPKSLASFLRQTPYTRLMWWPQKNFERVQVWRAGRLEPMPSFERQPYQELGRAPRIAALAGSLIYTLVGNLDDVSRVPSQLDDWYGQLTMWLEGKPDPNACPCLDGSIVAELDQERSKEAIIRYVVDRLRREITATSEPHPAIVEFANQVKEHAGPAPLHSTGHPIWDWVVHGLVKLLQWAMDGALNTEIAKLLGKVAEAMMPHAISTILGIFVSLDPKGQKFWDSWRCALPMDNQMNDQLWPTEFTELWVPLEQTGDVMNALHKHYAGDGSAESAFAATGSFSCEVYGAKSSQFWMSPSYGSDVVRIDVFWFGRNAGTPAEFYAPFFDVLKPFGFRPHWGKWLPPATKEWAGYYRKQLPMMDRFLEARAQLDPKGVFLSQYWSGHLGID